MARLGLIRNWISGSVVIPSSSSLSGSMLIAARINQSIMMPDEWTAGSLSFQVSACPGGTFRNLYSVDGVEVAFEAAACQAITNSGDIGTWYGMKIRSGSTVDDPDDQGAARTLVIFSQG